MLHSHHVHIPIPNSRVQRGLSQQCGDQPFCLQLGMNQFWGEYEKESNRQNQIFNASLGKAS